MVGVLRALRPPSNPQVLLHAAHAQPPLLPTSPSPLCAAGSDCVFCQYGHSGIHRHRWRREGEGACASSWHQPGRLVAPTCLPACPGVPCCTRCGPAAAVHRLLADSPRRFVAAATCSQALLMGGSQEEMPMMGVVVGGECRQRPGAERVAGRHGDATQRRGGSMHWVLLHVRCNTFISLPFALPCLVLRMMRRHRRGGGLEARAVPVLPRQHLPRRVCLRPGPPERRAGEQRGAGRSAVGAGRGVVS